MTPIVKICGLSTPATLEAALAAGADMVGFVFFAKSPRHIGFGAARALGAQARGRAKVVALSVDADDDLLSLIVEALSPDILQLHGRESPARVKEIGARFGRATMKAIGVAAPEDLAPAAAYDSVADFLLIDAKPPRDAALPGGNGLAFDWQALAGVRGKLDYMLAGGLTPANVGEAIRLTGATAVDVSSGVESRPGEKDSELIRRFLRAAKTAREAR